MRQVQHFGDRRRLFHVPATQSVREPGQLSPQPQAFTATADRQNLSLTLDRWVLKAQIETPSPQRITQAALFVRTQNNERDGRCSDRSQLGDCDLPGAQNL